MSSDLPESDDSLTLSFPLEGKGEVTVHPGCGCYALVVFAGIVAAILVRVNLTVLESVIDKWLSTH